MSNVLAGIGRATRVLDLRVQQRRAIAFRYREALPIFRASRSCPRPPTLHTNWLSCFLIEGEKFGCSRDELIASSTLRTSSPARSGNPCTFSLSMQTASATAAEWPKTCSAADLPPKLEHLSLEDQLYVISQVRAAVGSRPLPELQQEPVPSSEESQSPCQNFISSAFARRLIHYTRWVLGTVQLAIFAVAGVLAFLLRFDFSVPRQYWPHLLAPSASWYRSKVLVFHFLQIGSRMVAICFHSRRGPPLQPNLVGYRFLCLALLGSHS